MTQRQLKTLRRETVLALVYPLFLVVIVLLIITPTRLRACLARRIGRMSFYVGKKTRIITLRNLAKAYPQLAQNNGNTLGADYDFAKLDKHSQLYKMGVEVYENVMISVFDFFGTCLRKRRFFDMVEVQGEEHLNAAYQRGKGVICLIPHLSIWELSAVTPPMLGYPTSAASKPIKGKLIQATMVWLRARRGMVNFERDHSYQKLVEALNEGQCLILMIDQDTMVRGEFVDFFGHTVYTPLGCARLVMDTGCAVVPMATVRKSPGHYIFEIDEELPFIETGDVESDLKVNTQRETLAMEKIIRKYPTQWVWMHQRWKTTPESLAQFLERKRIAKQKAAEKERRKVGNDTMSGAQSA